MPLDDYAAEQYSQEQFTCRLKSRVFFVMLSMAFSKFSLGSRLPAWNSPWRNPT